MRPSSALALTVPVAMGYVPLGIVFGFLFVQAGATWWLAALTSLLVYAGASQFMMIPMLTAGAPVAAIALAGAIVNLRHLFYGLSLLDRVPPRGAARWYLAFALTDETYSVLTMLPRDAAPGRMVTVAALNQCWWMLGTLIGAIAGAGARIPLVGLDFALAALFAVLTVEQWRSRSTAAPLWVALIAYPTAALLMPAHALTVAIIASLLVAAVWSGRTPAETAR